MTEIVEETEQTSKGFFAKLEDPGNASVTEFVNEVERRPQRDGRDTLPGRRA